MEPLPNIAAPLIQLSKEALEYANNSPIERTLHTKWRNFTKDLPSPESFIDFGFYYLIGACLQRRVWTGASHEPLFGNQFLILVGDPGTGKSRVTNPIYDILHHHKLPVRNQHAVEKEKTPEELKSEKKERLADGIELYNKKVVEEGRPDMVMMNEAAKLPDRPLLFPVAADATSYQALIKAIAKAKRRKDVTPSDICPNGIYTHSSICFCLDELSSLLRKQTEDTVNFLVTAYNCRDYNYETIGRGIDTIQKCCVSLLAGTQPDFVNNTFKRDLVGQGWASRSWFIFEWYPRHYRPVPKELNEQQKKDHEDILARVKQLGNLYGHCIIDPACQEWFDNWIHDYHTKPRKNYNEKLKDYYSRINIHILKLAMAIHFADSDEMILPKGAIKKAMDMLESVENRMHYALAMDKSNPLAKVSDRLLIFLTKAAEPLSFTELHFAFWDDLKEQELRELLNAQLAFGNIVSDNAHYSAVKRPT